MGQIPEEQDIKSRFNDRKDAGRIKDSPNWREQNVCKNNLKTRSREKLKSRLLCTTREEG